MLMMMMIVVGSFVARLAGAGKERKGFIHGANQRNGRWISQGEGVAQSERVIFFHVCVGGEIGFTACETPRRGCIMPKTV